MNRWRRPNWGKTTAVITGASSGIGEAVAREFAGRGAAVVLAARRMEILQTLEAEIKAAGGRALAVQTDVTDEEQCRFLMGAAVESFGTIDILVNNAGAGYLASLGEIEMERARGLMELNYFAPLACSRAALPYMREQRQAHIINIASMAGKFGLPYSSIYSSTKFALIGLSESLRLELRADTGIRVSAVLPGFISTPFFDQMSQGRHQPLRPPGARTPEWLARRVAKLAERPRAQLVLFPGGRFTMGLMEWFPSAADPFIEEYRKQVEAAMRKG